MEYNQISQLDSNIFNIMVYNSDHSTYYSRVQFHVKHGDNYFKTGVLKVIKAYLWEGNSTGFTGKVKSKFTIYEQTVN